MVTLLFCPTLNSKHINYIMPIVLKIQLGQLSMKSMISFLSVHFNLQCSLQIYPMSFVHAVLFYSYFKSFTYSTYTKSHSLVLTPDTVCCIITTLFVDVNVIFSRSQTVITYSSTFMNRRVVVTCTRNSVP